MRRLYEKADYQRVLREKEEIDLGRSAFRRDFGRLLHSPACRRLQGKTQLFPGHESDFFRNRLTHSLEVAQVAKGIAQMLNARDSACKQEKVDLDLVEFAGLAHDLGHPPFGHNGEKALDDCMKSYGGFEGNAQTLRILARVEKKVYSETDGDGCGVSIRGIDHRLGLNLTFRSLAAVLKYDNEIPRKRQKEAKLVKGFYASESDLVASIKTAVGKPRKGAFKVIECQIMDIADDIAYSTYDLEDAMKGGFSHPMQLLARVLGNLELFRELVAKVRRSVKDVEEDEVLQALTELLVLDDDEDLGSLEQYTQSKMVAGNGKFRAKFSSDMIGDFMRGISIERVPGEPLSFAKIRVKRDTLIQIEAVKHLNYMLMIMSPRLKVVEYRGYEVVKTIFDALSQKGGHELLPDDIQQMYSRLKTKAEKMRVICDFVAGMTDRYAVEFYSRLKESGASIFKPI